MMKTTHIFSLCWEKLLNKNKFTRTLTIVNSVQVHTEKSSVAHRTLNHHLNFGLTWWLSLFSLLYLLCLLFARIFFFLFFDSILLFLFMLRKTITHPIAMKKISRNEWKSREHRRKKHNIRKKNIQIRMYTVSAIHERDNDKLNNNF